jgi:hypothetical protein
MWVGRLSRGDGVPALPVGITLNAARSLPAEPVPAKIRGSA